MESYKVLLAEDDRDYRNALVTIFENNGFEVMTAEDGNAAIAAAKKYGPDLVVLDVMMPGKDGYLVCHEIKNNSHTAGIPVLILTSLANKKKGKTAAEALADGHGADGFLEKPVKPEILIEKARDVIKQKSEAAAEAKPRILIIDDDPDFIAAVKSILDTQYEVKVAYTGEDGLREAVSENPDLIVVDVMLPGKDGFAVCKELKENQKTRQTPVVMLTSVGEKLTEPEFAKALAVTHHADDYLQKPVEAHVLISHIRNLIGPSRRLI